MPPLRGQREQFVATNWRRREWQLWTAGLKTANLGGEL
jgi:hypothetical protein